ncbi:MAG: ParB N-terminal domain-containing protein [Gemmobacter sp.]
MRAADSHRARPRLLPAYCAGNPEARIKLAQIPLDQVDTTIRPRDRSLTDEAALDDLIRSIEAIGLHHPIEVFGIEVDATYIRPYALISGYRRLTVNRAGFAGSSNF